MTDIEFLAEAFKKVNKDKFILEEFGPFQKSEEVLDGVIKTYDCVASNAHCVQYFYLGEELRKIKFNSLQVGLSVGVLSELLSEPLVAYNFREDVTDFAFKPPSEETSVKRITVQIPGNLADADTVHFDNFSFEF